MTDRDLERVEGLIQQLVREHPPAETPEIEFWGAQYDLGLAWVWHPEGEGGLGLPRRYQTYINRRLVEEGASIENRYRNVLGIGMGAGVLATHGTPEQKQRWLRPMFTTEEIWCQMFSEPGAGSDVAGLATMAVRDGDEWVVNGQKVWTTLAHLARWGMLVARTDPDVPKHQGLTYFILDMESPGVGVRPLYQITGEAEFNEVFFDDVRIPDANRIDDVGAGWRVALTTLMNERVAIGGGDIPREGGMIGVVADTWRRRPELRRPDLHARLMRLWVEAEVARLTGKRLRQKLAAGQPGPEGSASKLTFARLSQQLSGLEIELLGEEGLRYGDWTMKRPDIVVFTGKDAGYRYLRAKGNSIEGGTSEILRNIVAERVLGLPPEPRVDKNVPWKDLPR